MNMRKLLLWLWGSPVSGHGPSTGLIKSAHFPLTEPPGVRSADKRVSSKEREGLSPQSCSSSSGDGDRSPGPPGLRWGEGPVLGQANHAHIACKMPWAPLPQPLCDPLTRGAEKTGRNKNCPSAGWNSMFLISFIITAVASRWHFHIAQTSHQPVALPQALMSSTVIVAGCISGG